LDEVYGDRLTMLKACKQCSLTKQPLFVHPSLSLSAASSLDDVPGGAIHGQRGGGSHSGGGTPVITAPTVRVHFKTY
jgi:hypothetical protein